MSNPLAGAEVGGSTHGGWWTERPAASTPAAGPPERAPATEAPHHATAGEEGGAAPPVAPPAARVEERRAASATRAAEPRSRAGAPAPRVTEAPAAAPPAIRAEAAAEVLARVRRVSLAERADGRGLVMRFSTDGRVPAFHAEEIADGVIQLTLFRTDASAARTDAMSGSVRTVRIEQDGTHARVRIEVTPGTFVVPQAYPDRDSDDLLLALTYATRPVVAPAPRTGENGAKYVSQERWRLDCIVIDAGHGGRDPGAVHHGVRESDVNLSIALRLGRLIEDNLGVRVVQTRTTDRFVELAERGRIANRSCGKLFVSIHGNAAYNPNAHGTETFFLGLARTESARRVMERENSVIALESDPSLYSGMDEAALIMHTMAHATYLRKSEQLAALIEEQFASHAGRRSRGVHQAGFKVLWSASMPAVLVETGFISNAEEARMLASASGQQLIAESIYRAIREFKEQYERSLRFASN